MIAAIHGRIKQLSKEFYHDPTLKNNGWTVAMYASLNECIKDIPKEFYHNPTFKNKDG